MQDNQYFSLLPLEIQNYVTRYGSNIKWITGGEYLSNPQYGSIYFDNATIVINPLSFNHGGITHNTDHELDGSIFLYSDEFFNYYYVIEHENQDFIGKIIKDRINSDDDYDIITIPCEIVCVRDCLLNIYDKNSYAYKVYEEESLFIGNKEKFLGECIYLSANYAFLPYNTVGLISNYIFNDFLNNYFHQKYEKDKCMHFKALAMSYNFLRIYAGLPGLNYV